MSELTISGILDILKSEPLAQIDFFFIYIPQKATIKDYIIYQQVTVVKVKS